MPTLHDRVFAAVSHLPHLAAFALVDELAQRADGDTFFRFAASGFRDFTRIAGSSPEMWRDIALANREALLAELDAYLAALQALRQAVAGRRRRGLAGRFFRAPVTARENWTKNRILDGISRSARMHRQASGTVRLPGSKSISNRVLLLAALAEGTTDRPRPARFRRHPGHAGDALRTLGVGVEDG